MLKTPYFIFPLATLSSSMFLLTNTRNSKEPFQKRLGMLQRKLQFQSSKSRIRLGKNTPTTLPHHCPPANSQHLQLSADLEQRITRTTDGTHRGAFAATPYRRKFILTRTCPVVTPTRALEYAFHSANSLRVRLRGEMRPFLEKASVRGRDEFRRRARADGRKKKNIPFEIVPLL